MEQFRWLTYTAAHVRMCKGCDGGVPASRGRIWEAVLRRSLLKGDPQRISAAIGLAAEGGAGAEVLAGARRELCRAIEATVKDALIEKDILVIADVIERAEGALVASEPVDAGIAESARERLAEAREQLQHRLDEKLGAALVENAEDELRSAVALAVSAAHVAPSSLLVKAQRKLRQLQGERATNFGDDASTAAASEVTAFSSLCSVATPAAGGRNLPPLDGCVHTAMSRSSLHGGSSVGGWGDLALEVASSRDASPTSSLVEFDQGDEESFRSPARTAARAPPVAPATIGRPSDDWRPPPSTAPARTSATKKAPQEACLLQ
eukprot:TRINITY_DN11236_c0_g1_i1.p1 TRINITY_DN11236_c0_g1~~TRINITY_DN11236_c0_g1_i1.p1  ORF type:complete len:322 (+),score=80.95 TRINITY_DN11236_c0_g1_i1:281-1246(+)